MEFGPVITSQTRTAATTDYGTKVPDTAQPTAQNRELIKAVKALNSTDLFGHDSELTFVFDRETHRALVRVVNRQTREVMMQIPPEYVIRMAEENQRK